MTFKISVRQEGNKEFEAMDDPSLADRLRAFEDWLESMPCTHKRQSCIILSSLMQMCPTCRMKMHFFHCLYNAEAYEGTSGEIPRKK
jgi:hypothetical protein